MPRRSSQGHRTEITVAIIAMIGAVLVAFIANLDKIFPGDPAPSAQNRPQPQPVAVQPVAAPDAGTQQAAQRLSETEQEALNRYADTIQGITDQIDAQNANRQ
jgi:hypothetical protein